MHEIKLNNNLEGSFKELNLDYSNDTSKTSKTKMGTSQNFDFQKHR